jgi:hypothetical protein
MGNNARGNHFFALLFVVDSTDATSRLFKRNRGPSAAVPLDRRLEAACPPCRKPRV